MFLQPLKNILNIMMTDFLDKCESAYLNDKHTVSFNRVVTSYIHNNFNKRRIVYVTSVYLQYYQIDDDKQGFKQLNNSNPTLNTTEYFAIFQNETNLQKLLLSEVLHSFLQCFSYIKHVCRCLCVQETCSYSRMPNHGPHNSLLYFILLTAN